MLCPSCRALVDGRDDFCPACGRAMGRGGAKAKTVVEQPMPDWRTQPGPYAGPVVREAADPRIGQRVLGKYVIDKRLGEREHVFVYLGHEAEGGEKVAIKILDGPEYRSPAVVARFEREAAAARGLESRHVVHVHGHGRADDGSLCVVMEFLPGRTLAQLFHTDAPLLPERAVAIAGQICAALSEAHGMGIVHRDLTPPNVMVIPEDADPDCVHVLDLGVAKLEGTVRDDGQIHGSPAYMSPEQLRGAEPDARTDVYSLAVIVFEALTGQLPFRARDPAGYARKHLEELPPPMAIVNPHARVPPALEAAVLQALSKDPAARPPSAEVFADRLRAGLRGEAPAGYVPPIPASAPVQTNANPPAGRGMLILLAVGILLAAASLLLGLGCSPPRVAKVGTGSSNGDGDEVTTDPGWDDETTSMPVPDGDTDADEGADGGPRYDVVGPNGKFDLPPYHHDCPEPLPSTEVDGATALGEFAGVHAYFGDAWGEIDLVVFDENADLNHELDYAGQHGIELDLGPAVRGAVVADWEQLPAQDLFTFVHVTADEELWFMAEVTITDAEFEPGDPYVPAVIHGTFAPWPQDASDAVSGPFVASRCGVFEAPFPIE